MTLMNVVRILARKEYLILIGLILLGLFLRLYNFSQNYYFGVDEELMNLVERRIALGQHFPMVGSFSAIGSFLLPYFYYFGALLLKVSNLNPLGQGIFAAILGTFNIFFIYKVGKCLFNTRVGLFSAVLYSTSFLMVLYDRRFWHITFSPFLTLIIVFSILKIKQGSIKFVYLLTLGLLIGWSTDYVNLVLFLLVFISWFVFKLPWKKKEVLISVIFFVLMNIPIVAFDLRHDFYSSKILLSFFTTKLNSPNESSRSALLDRTRNDQALYTFTQPFITFSRTLYMNSDLNITEQHAYCKEYVTNRNNMQGLLLPILTLLITAGFFFMTFKDRKSKHKFGMQIVSLFLVVYVVGLLTYGYVFNNDIFEHYLANLLPIWFIVLGFMLEKLYNKKNWLVIVLLGLFMVFNVNSLIHSNNPLGYQNKLDAVSFAKDKLGDRPFSLDSIGECHSWDGYYYAFISAWRHPEKSFQDPLYAWQYDYVPPENHPDRIVVMVSRGKYPDPKQDEIYNRYKQWLVDDKKFGDLEVMILDNSKGDFH